MDSNVIFLIVLIFIATLYFSFFFFKILNKKEIKSVEDRSEKLQSEEKEKFILIKDTKNNNIHLNNKKSNIFAKEKSHDELLINEINCSHTNSKKVEDILEIKEISDQKDYTESIDIDLEAGNELNDLINSEEETQEEDSFREPKITDEEQKKIDDFLTNNL